MAINLQEISAAVRNYLNTKVAVDIVDLKAEGGEKINPNERFHFRVTVRNANEAAGGIRLTNVRYHLKVVHPTVGKLIVPASTAIWARSGPSFTDNPLYADTQVEEMYLFPFTGDERKDLDVGE